MSEPLRPQEPREEEELAKGPSVDGPPVDPTLAMRAMALTGSASTLIFAGAGIVFCLRGMMEAFLISMLIVIALAIGNIVLLTIGFCGRIKAGQYGGVNTGVGAAKYGGTLSSSGLRKQTS